LIGKEIAKELQKTLQNRNKKRKAHQPHVREVVVFPELKEKRKG